ncbi:MAG TPA: hypothetical protein VKE69_01080 [Planctomycetota bacterium]|nr:hypothetical protein [Planctomycetota bacterium]
MPASSLVASLENATDPLEALDAGELLVRARDEALAHALVATTYGYDELAAFWLRRSAELAGDVTLAEAVIGRAL